MSVNGQDFREPVYWLNKVNLKTYTSKTGAELAALTGVQLGKIYRCSSTGSGFILNNYYIRSADDTRWKVVYSIGGWQEILADAIEQGIVWMSHYPREIEFTGDQSGTGDVSNDDSGSGGIHLETGTTTDGRAQIKHLRGTCLVDWDRPAVMRFKMELDDSEQMIGRIGFHVSDYLVIPSNSDKQVGLEIDSSTTFDTFWSIITANGTTKSSLLTSNMPVSSNNTYRYILEYQPNVSVKLYVNGALIATKTTHLPNSGSSSTNDTFVCMVRTRHDNGKAINLRSIVLAFNNERAF